MDKDKGPEVWAWDVYLDGTHMLGCVLADCHDVALSKAVARCRAPEILIHVKSRMEAR
jgi:hypothetical protein